MFIDVIENSPISGVPCVRKYMVIWYKYLDLSFSDSSRFASQRSAIWRNILYALQRRLFIKFLENIWQDYMGFLNTYFSSERQAKQKHHRWQWCSNKSLPFRQFLWKSIYYTASQCLKHPKLEIIINFSKHNERYNLNYTFPTLSNTMLTMFLYFSSDLWGGEGEGVRGEVYALNSLHDIIYAFFKHSGQSGLEIQEQSTDHNVNKTMQYVVCCSSWGWVKRCNSGMTYISLRTFVLGTF